MPELPEVEIVKRGLSEHIIGRQIQAVEHDWPKAFPNEPAQVNQFMIGATITSVRRRAKVLIIDLSTQYSMIVHLKMTGQMVFVPRDERVESSSDELGVASDERNEGVVNNTNLRTSKIENQKSTPSRFGAGHPNESLINSLPDKSTRVNWTFADGSHLFFNDQRKFGWVKLIPTELVFEEPFFQKVGPEPLETDFTADVFIDRISRRASTTIKAALLDQTVLAGIGNIYADESLWAAQIHPETRVKDISKKQLKLLHKEIIDVLKLSISKGGSTDKTYVNAEGKKGSYISFARVFRREGLPCPRCDTEITKSRVAGRGTHTCESCQPKPKGKS